MTTPRVWKILVVDDQVDNLEIAQREIEDGFEGSDVQVEVSVQQDFDAGLEQVRTREFDVLVLDLRRDASNGASEDSDAGRKVADAVKAARFAPIIFWTALPQHVSDEVMLPMVTVIAKDDSSDLPMAVRAAIDSRALDVISDIESKIDEIIRTHMWNEVGPNWEEYADSGGETGNLAEVLITRLARSLESDAELSLSQQPHHRYIYPPVLAIRSPGDILRESSEDGLSWWIVLTPACDFAQSKVDHVLLAKAHPLSEHPKYVTWDSALTANKNGNQEWSSLRKDVLTATQGRYSYLPPFREIPELVIDLEDLSTRRAEVVSALIPVASLSSPFAESLLVQFSHFRGRIGTPDLDHLRIKERLVQKRLADAAHPEQADR